MCTRACLHLRTQLLRRCVENTCFKGPDATADVATFFSMRIVIHRFVSIMDATLNSRSGKRFFNVPAPGSTTSKGRTRNPETNEVIDNKEPSGSDAGNPMYNFDFAGSFEDFAGTTASDECSKCFTCKVPELRLVWWLFAATASLFSGQNFNTFSGNVTENCQRNGSFYIEACGPMGVEELPFPQWQKGGYSAGYSQMDARIFDSFAAEVIDLNTRIGSGTGNHFAQLVQAAHQWDSVAPDSMEQRAASLVYHFCRNMRHESATRGLTFDSPSEYFMVPTGSVEHTSAHFLFTVCKRFKYEIFSDAGRYLHQLGYDLVACGADKVACKKETVRCLGTCGGVDGSEYKHDFSSIISRTELGHFVLGEGFETQAAANCTIKTYVFKVPAFNGGDSFATFASRMQVRSGMTAISKAFCEANSKSCSVIQDVLERSPGLVFVNGAFRHKYTLVPPSPPPSPLVPPRMFAYTDEPPSPPPPPQTPPPFFSDAEQCLPLPRLSDYGLDITTDAVNGAETEERASCVFARRILDEKRRASACFAQVAFPYPPPPPDTLVSDTVDQSSLWKQRERLGDLEAYPEPRKTDVAQWTEDTAGAIKGTESLLDALGQSNPILKELLKNARDEIITAGGRRLMQRSAYSTRMVEVLITHEIMTSYGKGGIPGLTSGSCEALCEASSQIEGSKSTDICKAFAFKRAMPFSYVDKTGWCYLLQNSGACSIQDFGVELYTRQIESERQCSVSAPGLDNPLCVGLPSTRDDARMLTHADAAAAAYEVPDMNNPAPGSQGLPLARTVVEAMSILAFARQSGVVAFWAASPSTENGDVRMHWPTEDGSTLLYKKGESRCILIARCVKKSQPCLHHPLLTRPLVCHFAVAWVRARTCTRT